MCPALATVSCGVGEPERTSILLVTLDTTRADALSCTGAADGLTPHFDRVAKEGILYRNARTVAPLTLPAHSSMMTGLYPLRHGVRDNSRYGLSPQAQTLAEYALAAGYTTAAFVAAAVLSADFGLAQGFETYSEPRASGGALDQHYDERSADEVADAALDWLEQRAPGQPFLLWLHFFDPHAPYAPAPEMLERAGGQRYAGEIAGVDRAFGRVLEKLEGELDRTLILIVADHGEGMEKREMTHGAFCYDATMRVPWIVRYPDRYRAGERSQEVVSVADVLPTLLDAMDLDVEPGALVQLDGQSVFRRTLAPDRGVYVESSYGFLNHGWSPLSGWAGKNAKYLHSSEPELFDLHRDPTEQNPLALDERAVFVERALAALTELSQRPRLASAGVDPATLDQLQRLGYAAEASETHIPDPLEPSTRPAPATRSRELARYHGAVSRGSQGKFDDAIRILRAILEDNSGNAAAWNQLAGFLLASGKPSEAKAALEARLALGPGRASTHFNLANCFDAEGDLEAAELHYAKAVELEPSHPAYRASLEKIRRH